MVSLSRIPLNIHIVGRHLFLAASIKGRKESIKEIVEEVTNLWRHKLNFPHLSLQVVQAKLDKLLKAYKKCVKQGYYVTLNDLFDITKENSELV